MGQAAGTAACIAIDDSVKVQNVNIPKLQAQLTADQQALLPSVPAAAAILVDDTNATGLNLVGTWFSSTSISGYYGTNYLDDGNANKGLDSATFTPTLPVGGSYQVYARWTADANRATNVPIDIIYPGGTNTVIVNQTQQGGQWVLLMTTNFNAGSGGSVRIRNTGTTAYVIANAVEFLPYQPTISLWATDAQASRQGPQSGSFTIGVAGNTNTPLTVYLNLGGTAVNGVDYGPLAASVNIPAGVAFTNMSVTPFTNSLPVGNKTLLLSLAPNAAYAIGSPAAATVTINDTPINNWRLQYFGTNATNSAIAGDNAEPAADGVPNLMKYALGFNPLLPLTAPLFAFGIQTNGYFGLSFTRPDPPPSDVTYQVNASADLLTWCTNNGCVVTEAITINPNGTATVTSASDTPIQASREDFLRLSVSRK